MADDRHRVCRRELSTTAQVDGLFEAIAANERPVHTLILTATDNRDQPGLLTRLCLAVNKVVRQDESPLHVFLRLPLESVGEAFIRPVVDCPRLTLIHMAPQTDESPFRADDITPSPAAVAVATMAQLGLPIAVELAVRKERPAALMDRCRQWTVVNRGAGLILSRASSATSPESYARALLELYKEALVPADRLAPLNGFIASLNGRTPALPAELSSGATAGNGNGSQTQDCAWRGLRGHICDRDEHGHRKRWACRVADIVYTRLLSQIATDAVSDARSATATRGRRILALIRGGRMIFTAAPMTKNTPMAQDSVLAQARTAHAGSARKQT